MYAWIKANLPSNYLVSLELQWTGTLSHLFTIELHENDKQVCKKANGSLNAEAFLGPLGVRPCNLKVGYNEASCLKLILIKV
jgi:hypothetical protein